MAQFTVTPRRRDDQRDGAARSAPSPRARSSTTEAALLTRGASQLYISLGDAERRTARSRCGIYHKPLVLLIWLGALVMAFGGVLSLSDRRLRVGAPKPATAPARCSRRSEADARWLASHLLSRSCCSRCPAAYAVQPDEMLARSRAGSARARPVARTALHGLPEPVDRRFRRAAGARSAPAGARAAEGRRQRHAGARFSGRALWRVRSAEAAVHKRTRRCCGLLADTGLLGAGLPLRHRAAAAAAVRAASERN